METGESQSDHYGGDINCALPVEQRANGTLQTQFESPQQFQLPLSNDSVTDLIFLVDGSDSFNKINKGKNFRAPLEPFLIPLKYIFQMADLKQHITEC